MHTPGPWKAEMHMIGDEPQWFIQFDGPIIRDATIASMNSPCVAYNNAERDAHLIAAAPELLEALQEIIDRADQSNGGNGAQLPIVLHMREIAIAAIKKAKGE